MQNVEQRFYRSSNRIFGGVCAGLAPEVFDLDDEDYLHVLVTEVPPGQHGAVRSAVASCPKQALRLEE